MDHSLWYFCRSISGWRSADQRLLADIPWCLMSPLGFHWLANERPGQRHWTDKNKVTCLASDVENLFFPLVRPARHEWSWILCSHETLNLTLSTVSDPRVPKRGDESSGTHRCTLYAAHYTISSAISPPLSLVKYYDWGPLQNTAAVITAVFAFHPARLWCTQIYRGWLNRDKYDPVHNPTSAFNSVIN